MSLFEVKVRKIDDVIPHPNADRLELAVIGGYRAVVQKGLHKTGDLVVYIPTDSVIPDTTSGPLGIKSYLVGKYHNRVKAIRLRGEVSQGIVLPRDVVTTQFPAVSVEEGTDLAEALQIIKYEEEIPLEMKGHVRSWPSYLDHYDVENVNHPDCLHLIQPGEPVTVTEKLHGTNITISIGPGLESGERAFVCSRRLALKEADHNLYWAAVNKYGLIDKLKDFYMVMIGHANVFADAPYLEITLRGEVVGVQDLTYGFSKGDPGFFAFDVRMSGEYLEPRVFLDFCKDYDIPTAPVLYQGPYDHAALKALAEGTSVVHPGTMREGVVVKPDVERHDPKVGRVMVKFVSEAYLTRKGGTELH